ncbi:hypothetical protein CKAH01_17101 [Colletotrichum kahawae]|uniref:Uncharacterized protein n=1 Tax=Colletotrichum kahawae TaxID=34407 RepID=A0AAE0D4H3_COLKA|nr:hypothetical protein CKAH01_17101 [Colletotrichum kahawae]
MKTQIISVLSLVAVATALPFIESNKVVAEGSDATIQEYPAKWAREETDATVQEYPAKTGTIKA